MIYYLFRLFELSTPCFMTDSSNISSLLLVFCGTDLQTTPPPLLTLHEEVEVGSGELLVNRLYQDVLVILPASVGPSLPGSRCPPAGQRQVELGGEGEAEGRSINQPVGPDEGQRQGDDAAQAAPAVAENGDVRNDAEQRFVRPEEERTS